MRHFDAEGWIQHDENINIFRYIAAGEEPLHTHDFIEIVCILAGQGMHCVGGEWHPVGRGHLLFINLGQTHAFKTDGEMTIVNLLVNPVFIANELLGSENAFDMLRLSLFSDFSLAGDALSPLLCLTGAELADTESLIARMLDEFARKRTNYKTALKGCLLVLLTTMFRAMERADAPPAGRFARLSPTLLSFIEHNYAQKITLTELARQCFYEPAYFSRLFRACFGKSLTELVAARRMEEAMRLLLQTQRPVEDIALSVGYADKKQFYAQFRRHTGTTPGAFRRAEGQGVPNT